MTAPMIHCMLCGRPWGIILHRDADLAVVDAAFAVDRLDQAWQDLDHHPQAYTVETVLHVTVAASGWLCERFQACFGEGTDAWWSLDDLDAASVPRWWVDARRSQHRRAVRVADCCLPSPHRIDNQDRFAGLETLIPRRHRQ